MTDYVGPKSDSLDLATQGDLGSGGTYVTSLPGSPTDGQVVYYAADATNGVIWQLRYRSGASGSYKWEHVGGSSLRNNVLTSQTRSNTAYGDLTTTGPSITVPLAGDYEVSFGVTGSLTTGDFGLVSVHVGSTPSDDDSIAFTSVAGSTLYSSPSRTVTKTGLSASTVIKLQYKTGGGNTGTFLRRWIEVRPVRVA